MHKLVFMHKTLYCPIPVVVSARSCCHFFDCATTVYAGPTVNARTGYPVLILRRRVVKILIPLDGSDLALDAVHYALRLLHEGLKASFVLATVLDPDGVYEMLMVPDADAREGVNQAVGEQVLASGAALLTAADVAFERDVRSGYAATMLIEIAEDHRCDAIIIGVHGKGKGALASALLGSVSQAILHTSSVPVTIVKHAE